MRSFRRWAVAALLGALALGGCGTTSPTVSLDPSKPTANAATSPPATGTARDQSGDTASVSFSVGDPRPASEVTDEAVQSCQTLDTVGPHRSIAVPLHVSAEVTSSSAVDMVVRLGDVRGLTEGGNSSLPEQPILWAVTYSDTPPECQQSDGGTVHWSASAHGSKSWSAWMVLGGGVSPSDPSGRGAAGKIVISPSVQLSGGDANFEFNTPAARNVVQCSASDPAAGDVSYLAVDPVAALQHGCTSTADQLQNPSGNSTRTADRICITQYPDGTEHTQGKVTISDRKSSLRKVCDGFGAPEGLTLTASMKCALIAAAATYGGPPGSGTVTDHTLCNAAAVADAYSSGDWLGAAAGQACGYFGNIFATGAGVFAAGATSETGPGAVAVGVGTYKALAAGVKIACGGLFDGGATAVGTKFEADHETHVAVDIVDHGRCLALNQTHGTSFAAVTCPKS